MKVACDTVMSARKKAANALVPLSETLAEDTPSADDLAMATDGLLAVLTVMLSDLAAAATQAGDTELKAQIYAYQVSVEQAIVAVEGAERDKAKLQAAIELPAMESAEKAVLDACA